VTLAASSADRSRPGSGIARVGSAPVEISIGSGVMSARVSLPQEDRTVRLGTGRSWTCVRIEPIDSLFSPEGIDPASVAMLSPGTGSRDRVLAGGGEERQVGDEDRNGTEELTVRFAKEDLRSLFANLPPGRQSIEVTIEGDLPGGSKFRGPVTLDVLPQGRLQDARMNPNPSSGGAVLSLRTSTPGPLRLRVFDAQGRLVRVAMDKPLAAPGYHDIPIGAAGGQAALPTGIYFYKLECPEGSASGRFVVVK